MARQTGRGVKQLSPELPHTLPDLPPHTLPHLCSPRIPAPSLHPPTPEKIGWGVSDTAMFWSEATGRGWSYLWSLGHTPFGPLSSLPTLSFTQRDAMTRNMALAHINASVTHVGELMRGFLLLAGQEAHVKNFIALDQVRCRAFPPYSLPALAPFSSSAFPALQSYSSPFHPKLLPALAHSSFALAGDGPFLMLCFASICTVMTVHLYPSLYPSPPTPSQVTPYHQRISLFLFKLQQAMSALSRLDNTAALGYALSMAHDAAALHRIAHTTKDTLSLEMQCLGAKHRAKWWLLPGGAGVVCVGLLLWRVMGRDEGGGGRDKPHLY